GDFAGLQANRPRFHTLLRLDFFTPFLPSGILLALREVVGFPTVGSALTFNKNIAASAAPMNPTGCRSR
ncbi:MAG: hypothetical protein NC250_01815, partial [Alistipes senegalensis]|nr:hypothetical protein [Alistipes senegalensis]